MIEYNALSIHGKINTKSDFGRYDHAMFSMKTEQKSRVNTLLQSDMPHRNWALRYGLKNH